jgi:hypothetical protein
MADAQHMYVHTHIHTHIINTYVCTYTRMYVYTYVCIHTYNMPNAHIHTYNTPYAQYEHKTFEGIKKQVRGSLLNFPASPKHRHKKAYDFCAMLTNTLKL